MGPEALVLVSLVTRNTTLKYPIIATMKYRAILLFATCFLFSHAIAQNKPTTLNGTLVMKTGETFPYKLVITDSGDVVKGFSYTYAAPNETKAAIRGTLDRRGRTLTFREKEIIYTHTVQTRAFMCLVNANLEYTRDGAGSVLKGSATSREADNTACTAGEII